RAQKANARRRTLLRMKLDTDRAMDAHDRRKTVALMRRPRHDTAGVARPAYEAVGVVRGGESRIAHEWICRVLERVPPDLRNARGIEACHRPIDHAEPGSVAFLAAREEKLHPEADADDGK